MTFVSVPISWIAWLVHLELTKAMLAAEQFSGFSPVCRKTVKWANIRTTLKRRLTSGNWWIATKAARANRFSSFAKAILSLKTGSLALPETEYPACPKHKISMVPHAFDTRDARLLQGTVQGFRCPKLDSSIVYFEGTLKGFYTLEPPAHSPPSPTPLHHYTLTMAL